jgi:uncharacterized sulfatase
MLPITGKSILNILRSENGGAVDPAREYVFSGRERHSASRYENWGYPQRAIRSQDYLLVWNMKPERWPAGAPQRIKPGTEDELLPMHGIDENGIHHSEWAYTDIDASPTKSYIIENMKEENTSAYFGLAHNKRPEYELFDIKNDPYNLTNLAGDVRFEEIEREMKEALREELTKTDDPRVVGPDKEVFDSYIRYSPMREFPEPDDTLLEETLR